ncbi:MULTISPECIES: hypothetical protein [Variovorax]|uniref:NADH-quinone oxidoreductase subunit N n=1 Tax=Variovorax ginsengisoli TaxID=363844 RepID=A0ABT8RYX7_9BURK|nr:MULTISPECIES: hypothetical protein [Variovorax]MDM0065684.1 hypothetical protein [Variovorax sp. J31P207]MDM0081364.1 hypothetical protein [Variovorax sp. J31P179]MDN8612057.1 hypothetical protein [Variovorax ginsengisoli]MDO1531227.1 hypothetical protein [Variovorax ginsengisoli]
MDISFDLMFGALTLVVAGAALLIAPRERRLEFLMHIAMVTALTIFVVKMNA